MWGVWWYLYLSMTSGIMHVEQRSFLVVFVWLWILWFVYHDLPKSGFSWNIPNSSIDFSLYSAFACVSSILYYVPDVQCMYLCTIHTLSYLYPTWWFPFCSRSFHHVPWLIYISLTLLVVWCLNTDVILTSTMTCLNVNIKTTWTLLVLTPFLLLLTFPKQLSHSALLWNMKCILTSFQCSFIW